MALLTIKQIAAKIKNKSVIELVDIIDPTQIEDDDLADLWAELQFEYDSFKEAADSVSEYIRAYLEDNDA